MKINFSYVIPVFFILLLVTSFYSCDSDDNNPIVPGSQRCDRNLGLGRNTSISFPADSFFVIYKFNVAGDVTIGSYRYLTPSGPIDVSGVSSPHTFNDTFFFAQGDTAYLSYNTEIRNGSVAGSVNVFKFGTSLSASDSCYYSGN